MCIFKTRSFKWWEIGLIKICLLSLGIILGLYFYNYLLSLLWLWWSLFIITGVYFIIWLINEK
jgi:hypothetical protein